VEEIAQLFEKRRSIIEASAAEIPLPKRAQAAQETQQQVPGSPSTPESKVVSTGTGFYVNSHGYLLTNWHVVDGCKSITARQFDGVLGNAKIVASDELNDLAVIQVGFPVKNFAVFNSGAKYRQGDQVIVYGFPLAGALSATGNLTIGHLSALSGLNNDTRYLQISAPVQSGNSGGPLADDSGNVIGVITSKLNAVKVFRITGDFPQNVNFALKDVVVKSFLQANGIEYTERNGVLVKSTSDVGEQLRNLVAYIQCHGY
jgi:S1-C subfamily serine protease